MHKSDTITVETATFILHAFVEDIYIFSAETVHIMFADFRGNGWYIREKTYEGHSEQ